MRPIYLLLTLVFGFAIPLYALQASAQQFSLSKSFERADRLSEGEAAKKDNEISYNFKNCTLERTLVNVGYCEKLGEGDRDRIIKTVINLEEVSEIQAKEHRGYFMLTFQFDFNKPGILSLLIDRALNGAEGSSQRHFERHLEAIEDIDLTSGMTFTRCDGTTGPKSNDTHSSFFFRKAPDNWHRIADIARECRSPRGFAFLNAYEE